MKGFKFLLIAVVVLVVVITTVTPARADTPLPQAAEGEVPDLSIGQLVTDDYVPPDGLLSPDITAPFPLSPAQGNFVYSLTPKLIFARNISATAYKIYMYDIRTSPTLVYTYIGGTENCSSGYCWLKPPNKLKVYKYDTDIGGKYQWKVEAKIGSSWVYNNNLNYFHVFSKGYNSTFTYNANGWITINGKWTRTTSGYYKTSGILYDMVNTWRSEVFLDNVAIEVRMKRKTEPGSSNRIYFMGDPNPLVGIGHWSNGYFVDYNNEGSWQLSKYINGTYTPLNSWVTPYAEINDWNTFKIWVHNQWIYVWINDVYITSVYDTSRTGGAVGLAMYEDEADLSPLFVDYVKVYYSGVSPAEIPEGVEAVPVPVVDSTGGEDSLIR